MDTVKVSKEKAVTFVRATLFSKWVVNDWNHLPASIVEAPLETFMVLNYSRVKKQP